MRSEAADHDVVALIMAAGVASRFGSDKRRVRLSDGRALLETTLGTVAQSYSRYLLVTRPDDEVDLIPPGALASHAGYRLRAAHAKNGLGGSLGDAFRHLIAADDSAIAAAVILGDMPWLKSATCAQLNQHADPERIVVPLHQHRRGHPVLFGRSFWPALARLKGGDGAKAIMQANKHAVDWIDVEDDGVWRDVDAPRDLPDSK